MTNVTSFNTLLAVFGAGPGWDTCCPRGFADGQNPGHCAQHHWQWDFRSLAVFSLVTSVVPSPFLYLSLIFSGAIQSPTISDDVVLCFPFLNPPCYCTSPSRCFPPEPAAMCAHICRDVYRA